MMCCGYAHFSCKLKINMSYDGHGNAACIPEKCCIHGTIQCITTPFYFVDESGLIKSERDPFFAFGAIKISAPQYLYREIRSIRSRFSLREELKWSKMSERKYDAVKQILDVFLNPKTRASFSCVILKKDELDFDAYFQNDFFNAYTSFMILLLKGRMGSDTEIATIIADDYFSPKGRDIESVVRNKINNHFGRLAVGGCCQIDSKSSDLIQVTDLLLGAVLYDLKIAEKQTEVSLNAKTKILGYIHKKLNVDRSFFLDANGAPQRNYYNQKIKAMIFDPNYKKPDGLVSEISE